MEVVNSYIADVLKLALAEAGTSDVVNELILQDVDQRIRSCLSCDDDTHDVLQVLAGEEAAFWDPRAVPLGVRCLVNIGLRNSMLEDLHASCPTKIKPTSGSLITDEHIRSLTERSAIYLHDRGCRREPIDAEDNIFCSLRKSFPAAFHCLLKIARSSDKTVEFESIEPNIPDLPVEAGDVQGLLVATVSGNEPSFEPPLRMALNAVKRGELDLFWTDSFKMLTRNTVKLMSVIEFVLGHRVPFVSHNYYLTNGRCSKRNPPLRPAHYTTEITAKLAHDVGLARDHRRILNEVKKMLAP